MGKLINAIHSINLDRKYPCGGCENFNKCADELLACLTFKQYVSADPVIKKNKEKKKIPSKLHYSFIFRNVNE